MGCGRGVGEYLATDCRRTNVGHLQYQEASLEHQLNSALILPIQTGAATRG